MIPLFFFGIVPGTHLPSGAQVPSGPPAPHLDRTPHVQLQLQQSPAWQRFVDDWGSGWGIRWDERSATPRFLYAPGVSTRNERELVEAVAVLAGVPSEELFLTQESAQSGRRTATWRRFHQGAEVLGDQVAVSSQGGAIHGIWVNLSPLGSLPVPMQSEKILPLPLWKGQTSAATGSQATLVHTHQEGSHVVFLDRGGREVHRYDTRHYGTIEMSLEERTVGDPMIEVPARGVTVESQDGTLFLETDDEGFHDLVDDPLYVHMSGSELIVTNDRQPILFQGSPDMLIEGGLDVPLSATSVHHHFGVTWDWLKERRPEHPWLDETVVATVELSDGICNAYYTAGTINFLLEDPEQCHNLGQIADVTYHELGHGIHHYILESGTFAGDISEGSSDFLSATILDDPELAPNARLDGGYIRELDTDKRYPEDAVGEVHTDGLIWGSFLWNLREQWQAESGDAGIEQTDLLFLNALSYGPSMTDAYEAVILADDDDGDWSNSTPNACELTELLDQHGLGPGPLGVLVFEHDPVVSPGSFEESYPVQFSLHQLTNDCMDTSPVQARLYYTTDPDLPVPEIQPLTGEAHPQAWIALPLIQQEDDWSGVFPRQLPTTEIRYFIEMFSEDGDAVVSTHDQHEEWLYRFRVGDREELWCEDFETGEIPEDWSHGAGMPGADPESIPTQFRSEWEVGTPSGGLFVPDSPYEGDFIIATAIDAYYGPNNRQHLQSPLIELGEVDNPMRLLSYQRWLTVEDAFYDQVRLRANDQTLWTNLATEGGGVHHLDTSWTLHELDLLELEDPTQVQFDWSLRSDGGLEFGGWAMDQLCVVQLADLDGHYRVRDLTATGVENTLRIEWTQPWIQPLAATALVRRVGAPPRSPTDGALIYTDLDPQHGEQISLEDPSAVPGQTYYYAVFASSEAGSWVLETVEGENLTSGGLPELPGTTELDSEPDTGAEVGETIGCSCASAHARSTGLLSLVLSSFFYRRRRTRSGKASSPSLQS